MSKPSYLILGGCGFIGRNLVDYLVSNDLSSNICIADKARPELSWLSSKHNESFKNPIVTYKQCNLVSQASAQGVFDSFAFDYVINCAGETKRGMTKEVYEEATLNLGKQCAEISAKKGVKKFIQISNTDVYAKSKEKKTESSKIDPICLQAEAIHKLELELDKISGLNFNIVRTCFTYGSGDRYIIFPRIVIAAVYKLLNEPMKLLYSKKLPMNTVHVMDVCKAIVFLCEKGENKKIFNLCDKSNTTQGSLSDVLSDIFKIKYEFTSKIESKMALTMLKSIVRDLNDKHMTPWSKACQNEGLDSTPLSPYLNKQELKKIYCLIDGSAIEKLGFVYNYPQFKKEAILDIIKEYIDSKAFPSKVLL